MSEKESQKEFKGNVDPHADAKIDQFLKKEKYFDITIIYQKESNATTISGLTSHLESFSLFLKKLGYREK